MAKATWWLENSITRRIWEKVSVPIKAARKKTEGIWRKI